MGEVRERGKREREREGPPILSRVWTWLSGGEDVEEEEERGFLPTVRDEIFHTSRGERSRESFLLSGFFTSSGRGDSYAWEKNPETLRW